MLIPVHVVGLLAIVCFINLCVKNFTVSIKMLLLHRIQTVVTSITMVGVWSNLYFNVTAIKQNQTKK